MKKEMTIEEYDRILEEYRRAGVLYAKGGQLEPLTKTVLDRKKAQYPSWYNGTSRVNPALTRYSYLLSKCDKDLYIGDCCGVIKGIRMGNRVGQPHKYIPSMDETITSMRNGLEDVIIKDAYNVPHGYLMVAFDDSHVATVGEEGLTDVECAESCDGLKEVPLKYQNTSPDTYWKTCGKLPWIDYSAQEAEMEITYSEKVGDTIPMKIETIKDGVAFGSVKLTPITVPVKPVQKTIEVGSKVTINKGARSGGLNAKYKGKTIDPKYANGVYVDTVSKVEMHNGIKEALLKGIVTWVDVNSLTIV